MLTKDDLVRLFENNKKKKKKNGKLKLFLRNNSKLPYAASMFLLVAFFIAFGIFKSISIPTAAGIKFGNTITASVDAGPDLEHLDFQNVEKHLVPNAKETVIYIPQVHKDPTSNMSDTVNDQAVVIQKEISRMLQTLVDKNHINYVMDETDNYGPMPADKVQKIKNGLANIDRLHADVNKLIDDYVKAGGDQATADQMKTDSDTKVESYKRNIYLTGGAAVLAATDTDAHVYGSQNPATIAEATKQLQNIVYIEQRINELQSANPTTGGAGATSGAGATGSASNILSMLGSGNASPQVSPIQPIKEFAAKNNNKELQDEINKVTSESQAILSVSSYETAPPASATSAQAQTNPYANETDLNKLKQMDQDATNQFMKIAKDQRSQEAADNVDKMIQSNNQTVGVLVMGAQHKDQLVTDLNNKGISVIVITPESEIGAAAAQPTN